MLPCLPPALSQRVFVTMLTGLVCLLVPTGWKTTKEIRKIGNSLTDPSRGNRRRGGGGGHVWVAKGVNCVVCICALVITGIAGRICALLLLRQRITTQWYFY